MAAGTVDLEDKARLTWNDQGKTLSPSTREERTALLMASTALVDTLVQTLGGYEVDAEAGTARLAPSSTHTGRVMTLVIHLANHSIEIPVLVGETVWTYYPHVAPKALKIGESHSLGDPLGQITFPEDASTDQWIPVSTLVERIMDVLAPIST
ncbi:hypothetical protein [Sciscionella marina]|uniref:hypothetical protein n=1 Tax=Sciscionella marina TaxID=508770 RepID=UPI000374CEC3|nr:hypothetical protein [Sciscionella marina]